MSHQPTVWVVDDDHSIRWVLEKALEKAQMNVQTFENAEMLFQALKRKTPPDALVTDIRMPGMNGLDLTRKVNEQFPDLPVIIITAYSDLSSAVDSFDSGAFEYLPKPFDINEAVELVQRACGHAKARRQQPAQSNKESSSTIPEIIGEAPAMQEVFRAIGRLARSNITVLINGESGTGKELVAKALHKHSPRSEQPFIALNMAAIPRDLMESELFGHEKGSFTGAHSRREGRFEQADGGTLFLDEIGDMPPELQTRLLRVLADHEYYRVGGHTPVAADVRIVAATHQNLEEQVSQGLFREDLYHRLNVIRIQIPPLRDRRQDIPLLLSFFMDTVAEELKVQPKTIRNEVLQHLKTLDWPGNVRQLENTCRWMTVMASGQSIHLNDLPPELTKSAHQDDAPSGSWPSSLRDWVNDKLASGDENILDHVTPVVERILILSALQHTRGKRQEAARLLGWGRNTLTRKINELDMENDLS